MKMRHMLSISDLPETVIVNWLQCINETGLNFPVQCRGIPDVVVGDIIFGSVDEVKEHEILISLVIDWDETDVSPMQVSLTAARFRFETSTVNSFSPLIYRLVCTNYRVMESERRSIDAMTKFTQQIYNRILMDKRNDDKPGLQ